MNSVQVNDHIDYYIAGPWFQPEQNDIIETIKRLLVANGVTFFSPKDEILFEPGITTPQEILDVNVAALKASDFCVVVTDGRDPGTMFEAGWCYAEGVSIIYLWLGGKPEDKFNVVLAASGAVCRSYEQLDAAIKDAEKTGQVKIKNWGEEMRYE